MHLCVLDHAGQVQLHKNIRSRPEAFLKAIGPYRDRLVVACECIFCWYWLADLCAEEGIEFVLGHALYMKAILGGKTKNDRIDSEKVTILFLQESERAKKYVARLESKYGKKKALSIPTAKLGRAVYFVLLRRQVFEEERFFAAA